MELTAYNQDTEAFRIERLRQVQKRLERGRKADPLPILALHDCKGTLYVNWDDPPTTEQIVAVSLAWRKERECLSNHYVRGAPLLEDVLGGEPW